MMTESWFSLFYEHAFFPLLNIGGILVGVLMTSALLIWVERRMVAILQDRLGPNRIGPLGVGQLVADTIKMFFKEDWIPEFADRATFIIAPAIVMAVALLGFAVVPMAPGVGIVDLNIGILYIMGITSLGVYSILLAGYSSANKYALIGGVRAAAQTIAYEVYMGLSLMGVVMLAGSFNLREIVNAQEGMWFIIPQCLGFLIFTIAGFAETHRAPFNLPEAEQELTQGFHTEYSGMKFGMFYIGEYGGVVLTSALITTLFLGGWHGPFLPPIIWFMLKTLFLILFFILVGSILPRPRYDQLMAFGWKVMLPLSLLNVLITAGLILL